MRKQQIVNSKIENFEEMSNEKIVETKLKWILGKNKSIRKVKWIETRRVNNKIK